MENKSIWNDSNMKIKSNFSNKVDVLVIGGSLSGLLTSLNLMDTNNKIMLIDKGYLGNGVSINSTSKATYLQKDIYQKIYKNYGIKLTKMYLDSQKEAVNILKNIIDKYHIKCDLEESKSFLYANTSKGLNKLNNEKRLLEKMGVTLNEEKLPLSITCKKSFSVNDTYVFNPHKFMDGLVNIIKDKIMISEHTRAQHIEKQKDKYLVFTNKGIILTKKIVLACHYPFFLFPYFFPIKMYVEREYINYGLVDDEYNFNAINLDDNLSSIRFYNNHLIYVSNNHRINNKIPYNKSYLKSKVDFEKKFKIKSMGSWTNQDLFTHDSIPLADELKKNMYVLTGYNGWGITNSVICSRVISNRIENIDDKYDKLFSLSRNKILTVKNVLVEAFFNTKSYLVPLFIRNNRIQKKRINGVVYNVYQDYRGYYHYAESKCPHLKCNLVFNKNDLSWDCPCHGSRFDIDGNLIEGPAKKNIGKK